MNHKNILHNTTFSVQLPNIAGHFLQERLTFSFNFNSFQVLLTKQKNHFLFVKRNFGMSVIHINY